MDSEIRPPLQVDLRQFSTRAELPGGDDKGGRGLLIRAVWMFVNAIVFLNPVLPAYRFKCWILRLFGAQLGKNVIIKPCVSIKYPWHLKIGDHTWIGERAWLDNLAPLTIGSHVVISQACYLSGGSHDTRDPGMGTIQTPIVVEDGAWITACSRIVGNVRIGQEAIVAMGSVVFSDCEPRGIYRGNPAVLVGRREIREYPGPRRPEPH